MVHSVCDGSKATANKLASNHCSELGNMQVPDFLEIVDSVQRQSFSQSEAFVHGFQCDTWPYAFTMGVSESACVRNT